ncbi:caspase family protein [Lacipirellula limnantheis]|uniref:Caspase domain protein n=1 Tax=Lacipirellula limnantheis TaxID=2528024 RepID=A0A517TYH4_9BACT|nr:caspase family protein [Lacipirellula limnantheis]QDT73427.1 Caspase domain protein [Lacipirellula limnantheis]
MKSLTHLLVFSVAMFSSAGAIEPVLAQQDGPGKRAQRYALLVGVNDYSPPLGKLEYCLHDMQELSSHFTAAGFPKENVALMYDQASEPALRPSKVNLGKQLELRLQLANEEDIVVVAFSGHGIHIDGQSYLCPADARLDDPASLISIDDVYTQMEKCRAAQKVLIIDACRNEPIVRGFKAGKLADDLSIDVQSPPKGVIVLSSCEPKQFSAEDEKLKHGVFMYYVLEGLKGQADSDQDVGGNQNGRVSLDELYFYAHEKTKLHVATSHGILQRPVMKGEMVGRFDLAMVPDSGKLKALAQDKLQTSSVKPAGDASAIRGAMHPLLTQGDAYLRQADFENAINAYTAALADVAASSEVHNEARKNRGAAYLARGGKADIDNALIDQLAAGLPGIRMTVKAASADLKVQQEHRGRVKKNQTVLVSKISGDWLWVESVDGSDKVQGYLQKSAFVESPVVAESKPAVVSQPSVSGYSNSANSDYRSNSGYRTPNGGNRNANNGYHNQDSGWNGTNRGNGRPPSIWETPEWESLEDIRRGRANGTLR